MSYQKGDLPTRNDAAFEEVLDFLTSSPSLEQIREFHPSEKTHEHLSELLHKNGEGQITKVELAELDRFLIVEHFMRMLKIKAFEKLDERQ